MPEKSIKVFMPRSKLPLKTLETLLLKLITAPEGVKKALQEIPKTVLPIKGDARLSAIERLDIYADMYFYRIRDALKEDFPALLKRLGEIGFHNLITEYLLPFPSTHFSLRYAGQHLPRFLKKHRSRKQFPYLAELAQLEWALLTAFDAPDSPVLSMNELKNVAPKGWSTLRIHPVLSLQALDFSYPIERIRTRALNGKKITSFKKEKTHVLVWRRKFKILFRSSSDLENKILRKLREKVSFGDLCHWLEKRVGQGEASPRLARFLQTWLQEGLLAGFSTTRRSRPVLGNRNPSRLS